MKLVEILARELKEWPEAAVSITQDYDGDVGLYKIKSPHLVRGDTSTHVWHHKGHLKNISKLSSVASDAVSAIVTRADWEAERAKLKATKANGDGWIRHRGGKCPVEEGTLVEVRNRAGDIALKDGASCTSVYWHWSHDKHPGDIMAYKIHKPAEQPALVSEETIKATEPGTPDTMLAIRDRIRALDTQRAEVESTYQRQISEITQERESLVQKLAGEGLALFEVLVQPAEDMSDWRNWRAGDLIRHVEGGWRDFTKGKLYQLTDVNETAVFLDDDVEPRILSVDSDTIFPNGKFPAFKWHSRPAS